MPPKKDDAALEGAVLAAASANDDKCWMMACNMVILPLSGCSGGVDADPEGELHEGVQVRVMGCLLRGNASSCRPWACVCVRAWR